MRTQVEGGAGVVVDGRRTLAPVLVDVARRVRQDEVGAHRQCVAQRGDDARRVLRVGDEVHDGHQHQRHRPVEVDDRAHLGVVEDRTGVAQVGQDDGGVRVVRQYPRMGGDDGVVVDVRDTGLRGEGPGDLVHVGLGGQPRAHVEYLADAALGHHVPHGAVHEVPVGEDTLPHLGRRLHELLGGPLVDLVVVLAAQEVVVHPGGMGPARVDPVGVGGVPAAAQGGHADRLLLTLWATCGTSAVGTRTSACRTIILARERTPAGVRGCRRAPAGSVRSGPRRHPQTPAGTAAHAAALSG